MMMMSDFFVQFEIVFFDSRFDINERVVECGVGDGSDGFEYIYTWMSSA